MSAAIVVAIKQKEIINALRSAKATSEESAKTLEELECSPSYVFRRLMAAGVIRVCPGERYFINEVMAAAYLARFRRMVFLSLAVGVVVVAIALALR